MKSLSASTLPTVDRWAGGLDSNRNLSVMPSKRRRGLCGSFFSAFHVAVILDQPAFSRYFVRATPSRSPTPSRRPLRKFLRNGLASLLNPLNLKDVVPPSLHHHHRHHLHAASPSPSSGDRTRSILIPTPKADEKESDIVNKKSRSQNKSADEDNKHEHRIEKIVAHQRNDAEAKEKSRNGNKSRSREELDPEPNLVAKLKKAYFYYQHHDTANNTSRKKFGSDESRVLEREAHQPRSNEKETRFIRKKSDGNHEEDDVDLVVAQLAQAYWRMRNAEKNKETRKKIPKTRIRNMPKIPVMSEITRKDDEDFAPTVGKRNKKPHPQHSDDRRKQSATESQAFAESQSANPWTESQAFRALGGQRSKNRNYKAAETSTRIVVKSPAAGLKPHVDISEADLRQKPLAGILLQHVKQVAAHEDEMAEQQKAENKPASPGLTAGEEQKMKTQDSLVASISRYDDTARRCGLPTFEFGVDGKGNFCASKWITLVGGGGRTRSRPDLAGGGPDEGSPRTLQRSAVAARIATDSSRTTTAGGAAGKIIRPTTTPTTSTTLGVAPNFPVPQPLFHLTERAVYMISMYENDGPRRANLTRDVALLSPKATIVEAVDGNKEKQVRTLMGPASLYPWLPRKRGGVLGCALSHLKSVNLAVQQGREHAIFLEEDVSLDLWPLWVRSIDDYLDKSPELSSSSTPFQAVQLGQTQPGHPAYHYRKFNMSRSTIVPQAGSRWGTFAFTLSRAGMERVHKKFFRRSDNTISFEEMEQKCPPIVADDCVFGFCGPASELSLWHEGRTKLLPHQFFTEPPFFTPKPSGGIHGPDRSLCHVMKLQYQNCKDLLAAEHLQKQ